MMASNVRKRVNREMRRKKLGLSGACIYDPNLVGGKINSDLRVMPRPRKSSADMVLIAALLGLTMPLEISDERGRR